MLVLRRRAHDAIVFEGGLLVTLVEVIEHRAWLGFSSPSITSPVVVAPLTVGSDSVCLGIRSPASQSRCQTVTTITLGTAPQVAEDSVLLLNCNVGDRLQFEGLALEIASVGKGRAVLAASTKEISDPVSISVFTVSGAEVKIGIDAPAHLGVYREEVWAAMRRANREAAGWSSEDLEGLADKRLTPAASADRSLAPDAGAASGS